MKTVFMHIGAGKTGSSAIQSFLTINQNQLKDIGFYYPLTPTANMAKNFKTTSGNSVELSKLLNSEIIEKRKIKHFIYELINDAEGKNIVLSSENLCSFKEKNAVLLKKYFKRKKYQVVIVYYVRAIADILVSNYHQQIKRKNYTGTFNSIINKNRIGFLKIIQKCLAVFDDNVILKNYDKAKKDIFLDFLNNVLQISDTRSFTIENKVVNRSLTPHELAFMRHMNKYFTDFRESTLISNTLIHDLPDLSYRLSIGKDDLAELKNMYTQQIESINTYLDENEKPLTLVDDLQITEDPTHISLNPFQESVVAILAMLTKRSF